MDIHTAELKDKGYVLLEELDHNDIVPFVRKYIRAKTIFSKLYIGFNLVFAALLLSYATWLLLKHRLTPDETLAHLGFGCALAFLLIPLHEYLHILAYKFQGAQHTSFAANLRRFYFLAIADKFVANKKEFTTIALAPFAIISSMLLVLALLLPGAWSLTALAVLLVHTAFCSGDFALLSYFAAIKEYDLVTYDDKDLGKSFFLGKLKGDDRTTL